MVSFLSLVVVAVSAFAWVEVRAVDRSTSTASLIASGSGDATAEQNILLVGVDSRTDTQGNPLPPALLDALHAGDSSDGGDTADTLIVVHVPAGGGRATAISVPRDSYVQLAGTYGRHKINSAYSRAAQSTRDALTGAAGGGAGTSAAMFAPETLPRAATPDDPAVQRAAAAAGARETIQSVEGLTGLPITHYAAVNLAGFADLSQAIGGVPVCLRAPVDDSYSGLVLGAGPQEVSGTQALAFVRQRHGLPNGDLDRIARQQVFLASATRQLLSAGTLANPFAINRLSGVVSRSVTLDAGWNVLGFAQQLQGLSAGAVTFRTIPTGDTELPTPSDGDAVAVNPLQVRAFIGAAIADDAGRTQAAPTTTAAPAPTTPAPAPAAPSPVAAPITAASPGCVN